MQDCLQVRPGSPDPRRTHAAGLLRSQRLGLFADGDASVNGVEVLVSLAEELCAAAPTVMVLTVQTHISHILTKLGAKGRVNIVREALRQGISA